VEFRIKNIEDSIMPEKLAEYVAKKGSKSSEMKMGPINKTPNDLSLGQMLFNRGEQRNQGAEI